MTLTGSPPTLPALEELDDVGRPLPGAWEEGLTAGDRWAVGAGAGAGDLLTGAGAGAGAGAWTGAGAGGAPSASRSASSDCKTHASYA